MWLKTVEAGTRYIDGHYEIPLPLKEDAQFPDNKQQSLLRAEHLKRKINKNDKYMEDYKKFVNDLIGKNYAEKELREELKRLQEKKVREFLLKEGITWIFNPPGASSHDGVWEIQIRSIRKILNGLLREQTLTEESLRTLLCEVESILNSTPITTVSGDATDLQPLTPNDLLLLRGGPTPDSLFTARDSRSARRWRQMQYLVDIFWKRWIREYLPLLKLRHKCNKVERNLAVNDVVLVMDTSTPRSKWPLGRVKETFPDRNGFVRSAMVQTETSVLKRPISKLVLILETE